MSLSQLRVGLLCLLSVALTAAPLLTTGEYYFDSDPGFGQGTPFSFTSDSTLEETVTLDITELEQGGHTLFIRVLDDSSHWSFAESQQFYIGPTVSSESPPNLTKLEYFIGDDPGFGLATQIAPTGSNMIDDLIQVATAGLEPGFHQFGFRAQDNLGQWGPTETVITRVDHYSSQSLPDLSSLKYSLDAGNTWDVINLTPTAPNIDQIVNIPLPGLHPDTSFTLWTQVQDALGYSSFSWPLNFGINQAPVATSDSVRLAEDGMVEIFVLNNDTDIEVDPLSIFSVGPAQHGNLSHGDSSLIYEPLANFFGADSFMYTVIDLLGGQDSAMVFVQVAAVNDAPSQFKLLDPVSETIINLGSAATINFTWETAQDVDGDDIQYRLIFATDSIIHETAPSADTSLGILVTELPRDESLAWYVAAYDTGLVTYSDTFNITIDATVGLQDGLTLPDEFALRQNYPNPFNPITNINFGLPIASDYSLVIYDIRGRTLQTWQAHATPAGWYSLKWYGTTESGGVVSTGIYFARLVAGSYSETIKMVYLR